MSRLTPERTFLFTDIEASSKRWADEPTDMVLLLPVHNDLIGDVVSKGGGEIFGSEGDSQAAWFDDAGAALVASVEIQRRMATVDPSRPPLRVRIGIHTGAVYDLGPHFLGGPALNFVGRLHKAGHGGQILVSARTAEVVASSVPDGCELVDLGEHLLRDLGRVRIFQLCHPELRREFGPLAAARCFSPLRPDATSFIGRRTESVVAAFDNRQQLTTLTGPGGIGKTRFAFELARGLEPSFRDGVCVVGLASVTSVANIAAAIADALYADPNTEPTVEDSILRAIQERQLLLVLDNCEHLLPGLAEVVTTLLARSQLTVLATSRAPLGVRGEVVKPLGPLTLAPVSLSTTPADVMASEAGALFVARATSAQPQFRLTSTNALLVARLCAHVGGIPLALELAAARLRVLSIGELESRLSIDLGVLDGGAARAGSVEATINWSLHNLDTSERSLLAGMSLFRAGGRLTEIDRVCTGSALPSSALVHHLGALVDRAIVVAEPGESGYRYSMLEPMRLEAETWLHAHQRDSADRRHAAAYADLMRTAGPKLRTAGEAEAASAIEDDYANVQAAVRHLLAACELEEAAQLTTDVHEYAMLRMRYDAYGWADELLRCEIRAPVRVKITAVASIGAFNRGDLARAERLGTECLELAHMAGVVPHVYAYFALMATMGMQRRFDEAQQHFVSALEWCRRERDDYHLVNALVLASMAMVIQNQREVALHLARQAVGTGEAIGNPSAISWAMNALAEAERVENPEGADVHLVECLSLARSARSRWVEGFALLTLARLRRTTGQRDGALAALVDALSHCQRVPNPTHLRQALQEAFLAFTEIGCHEEAALLHAAAFRDREVLPPGPDVQQDLSVAEGLLARSLGSARFAAMCEVGRRTTEADLVARARAGLADLARV